MIGVDARKAFYSVDHNYSIQCIYITTKVVKFSFRVLKTVLNRSCSTPPKQRVQLLWIVIYQNYQQRETRRKQFDRKKKDKQTDRSTDKKTINTDRIPKVTKLDIFQDRQT